MIRRTLTIHGLAVAAAAIAAGGLVLAALFVWSGIYNVSASRQHLDVTTWLLDIVRRQSVRTYSLGIETPPLDDPGLIRLGAAHYELGCASCHGAPGRPASALAGAMLPEPPPLDEAVRQWQPKHLFWIVLNGQKYTGMPAWVEPRRPDEVWSVIAFLRHLATLDAAGYRKIAGLGPAGIDRPPGIEPANPGALAESCRRCHDESGAIAGGRAPPLSGQTPVYLARALSEYAAGSRPSGIMQLVARPLPPDAIERLARRFSSPEPMSPISAAPPASARGRDIARLGIPSKGVPACLDCHADHADARFPRLAGLPTSFIEQQLALFRGGTRRGTAFAEIMRPIAQRLAPDEAAEVARYFASGARDAVALEERR
ncbi:MAG: c-type cytochrome [Alphaproteobacteria bacterium]